MFVLRERTRPRRSIPVLALIAALALTAAAAVAAGVVSWGTAVKVTGPAGVKGEISLSSVSCAGAGNCSAGGWYSTSSGQYPFVVSEKSGKWGKAIKVPGLNSGAQGAVASVSCGSAGNCVAGGSSFVVAEKGGVWGKAIAVRRPAPLNTRGFATVASVSCASAGNCAAGGWYGAPDGQRAFVLNEVNGSWRKPIEVPGSAALNAGNVSSSGTQVRVTSVSCASAGNCAAGGYYTVGPKISYRAFVVDEKGGKWGSAIEVPGTAALNHGNAGVNALSCASAGNCAVVGYYVDGSGTYQGFVADENGGVWGTAMELQDPTGLNAYGAYANSVSCASAGNCVVGGSYADGPGDIYGNEGNKQAFVANETGGVWHQAIEVPGTAGVNVGHSASVSSVSCVSAGNCAAGGSYSEKHSDHLGEYRDQAFVVAEKNGVWGNASEVPGTAALNQGDEAGVSSISCARAGRCAIGGQYTDASSKLHAFLTAP